MQHHRINIFKDGQYSCITGHSHAGGGGGRCNVQQLFPSVKNHPHIGYALPFK